MSKKRPVDNPLYLDPTKGMDLERRNLLGSLSTVVPSASGATTLNAIVTYENAVVVNEGNVVYNL